MKGYMYILECADGSYYTGSTKDLELRLQQHQNGEGANHTRKHRPVKLLYHEEFQRIDEAFYREKQVQGWSRKKKEALMRGDFGKLSQLSRNYTEYGAASAASAGSATAGSAAGTIGENRASASSATSAGQTEPEATVAELVEAGAGKTMPKLRFSTFQKEWNKDNLSNISKIITGSTPSTFNKDFYGGNIQFVSPSDIQSLRYIIRTNTTLSNSGFEKSRKVKKGSVLFVCIGSTIGKVAQTTEECATNQQINALVPYRKYSSDFVFSLLEKHASKIKL